MFTQRWARKLRLVCKIDGAEAEGVATPDGSIDFGNFFDIDEGGRPKEPEVDVEPEEDDDVADTGEDEPEDESESEGEGEPGEPSEQDEDEPDDTTKVSIAAIQQQQKILEDLLRQREAKADEQPGEEPVEVDPFESEEFSKMKEVMSWDDDEAEAAKVFFQKFMNYGQQRTMDEIGKRTPQMIESTIQQKERLKAVRQDFYEKHPALGEVKAFVGQIAQGVAKEIGQEADIETVLNEAATRAYKALNIDGESMKASKASKGKKPAFPVKKGTRKQKIKAPKLQQEIDAVIGA